MVYNSLGSARTDMVSLQVPICNVAVSKYTSGSSTPQMVPSQVTAQFTINDGVAPFYDFDLHFEATAGPLGYTAFVVAPMDSSEHCGGGDMFKTTGSHFTKHVPTWPPAEAKNPFSARDAMIDQLICDQKSMLGETCHGRDAAETQDKSATTIHVEQAVDGSFTVTSDNQTVGKSRVGRVTADHHVETRLPAPNCSTEAACKSSCRDPKTNTSTFATCAGDGVYYCCDPAAGCGGLWSCPTNNGLAACACNAPPPPPPKLHKDQLIVMENKFLKVYVDTAHGIQAVFDKGAGKNYTLTHQLLEYQSEVNDAYDFKPTGPAAPVKGQPVRSGQPGQGVDRLLASSVSLGPVMQEVRLQASAEHKTR